MKRKTVWLLSAMILLLGAHAAWATMTHSQAVALSRTAYNYRGSQKGAAALKKLESAASGGDTEAQNQLGVLYFAESHDTKAVYWLKKASAQGNADAQDALGNEYSFSQGVPKDYAKAAYWFQKSAAQGYAGAEDDIAFLHAKGRGVPKDDAKAVYWFRKAAAQGNPTAQRDLQMTEREHRAQQH